MADVVNRGSSPGALDADSHYVGFGKINAAFATKVDPAYAHAIAAHQRPESAAVLTFANPIVFDVAVSKNAVVWLEGTDTPFNFVNLPNDAWGYVYLIQGAVPGKTIGTITDGANWVIVKGGTQLSKTAYTIDVMYYKKAFDIVMIEMVSNRPQAPLTNNNLDVQIHTGDWNTCLSSGFYGANALTNECPGTSWRYCIVVSHTDHNYILQQMSDYAGTGVYQRVRYNGTWGSWRKLDSQPADITKAEIEAKLTGTISTHTHSGLVAKLEINSQTGTTYTFVLVDAGKLVRGSNASAQTYTIPPNSSVAYEIGTIISIEQQGAGVITIAAGSGVTINTAAKKTWGQYSTIQVVKVGTDIWNVVGATQ
jgi:hypothetical protein